MALPNVFTSGDVFTAANANLLRSNQYNQTVSTKTANYVLVASDVGTRVLMNAAGTTTITVNTSLFSAGDTLEIANIGAGVCTITSGTCTVTSSATLALAQYASGTLFFTSASAAIFIASAVTATAGGLNLISTTTFSAVNSVSLATNSLTSTYQNYSLVVTLSAASALGNLRFRYRASGTDYSGALYYTGGFTASTGGTVANDSISGATATSHQIAYYAGLDYIMGQVTLFNPQGTGNTRFTSNFAGVTSDGGAEASIWAGGVVLQNTQYDSITLLCSGATTITGNARLYGLANS